MRDKAMKRYVIDTSIFTNPDIFVQFGPDTNEAIRYFMYAVRKTDAEFYMPRSIYEELQLVKDIKEVKAEMEAVINIRSPRRYNLMIPSEILYEFIDEVRLRIDRGLRVAEEHTRLAGKIVPTDDMGHVITRLRDRFRETLRKGIIDSREDADVVMLAYELDGTIVSADDGLRKWADRVGIMMVDPTRFGAVIEELIKHKSTPNHVTE
jgi:hypothetical protein